MVHAARGEIVIGGDSLQMPRFRAAYDQLLPEIERMEKRDLLVVNLDIPTIVTLVLGKISKMRTLRDACAGLPGFDLAHFDRIEPLALAMGYTHGLHAAASVPRLSVPELSARAVEMRQALVKDCEALAQRGLLDGRQLKELKGPVGYKNQAFDLVGRAQTAGRPGGRSGGVARRPGRAADRGDRSARAQRLPAQE